MSKKNRSRTSAQAATVLAQTETSKPAVVAEAPASTKDSIRKTIREGLLAGLTTEVITQQLQEKFPQSKAAAKASKHIAFYRSKLRGEGLLPKRGQAAVAVAQG